MTKGKIEVRVIFMETQQAASAETVKFDGRIGELYKIFFLNLFLGIITLGIYHFWGKTRIRRYITSSFELQNDRFEYTGYGGELMWGFIKALIILLLLAIPLFGFFYKNAEGVDKIKQKIQVLSEEHQKDMNKMEEILQEKTSSAKNEVTKEPTKVKGEESSAKSKGIYDVLTPEEKTLFNQLLIIAGIYWVFYAIYLPFVAIFSSLKYRVTRTHWRGIRAHLSGSSIYYGLVGVFHLFLKIVTLGLWIPFGDALLWKFKMKRLNFGNQQAVYHAPYFRLFLSHLGTILFSLVLSVLAMVCFLYLMEGMNNIISPTTAATSHVPSKIGHELLHSRFLSAAMGIGILVFIMVGFIARFWYRATLVRAKYNRLRFGDIGFACSIKGGRLFRQQFGNFLILLFTLGLGYPIVKIRRQRFFCRHFKVLGDLQNADILQATGERDKWGEGLGSMFDLEIGLF